MLGIPKYSSDSQHKMMPLMGMGRVSGGFTLLEVLIAMFIFAFIATAIFTAYRGTFNVIDETESQEEIYQMARTAMERISGDLASAYLRESTGATGTAAQDSQPVLFHAEMKEIRDLPCAELRFQSLAHLKFSMENLLAEPAEISYYAAAGTDEGVLDLYRSDTSLSYERPEEGAGGLLLCRGLSSIAFVYYDDAGEAHENWDSGEGPSKGKLPSRVAIHMEFPNRTYPDEPFRFMTGVAIPMGG